MDLIHRTGLFSHKSKSTQMSEFIRESDLFLARWFGQNFNQRQSSINSSQGKEKRKRKRKTDQRMRFLLKEIKNAHFRRCKERLLEQASDGLMDINMCSCLSKQHFEELETYGYRVTISPFKCPDDLTRYQISWDKHTVNPGSQVSDTNNCSQSDW